MFDSTLEIKDVTTFNVTKYLESVAFVAGASQDALVVENIQYQVTVGYILQSDVTETQALAAVATSANVSVSAVRVTITAKDPGGEGRQLAATSLLATINTEEAADVALVAARTADPRHLEMAMQKQGVNLVVLVAAQPRQSVAVTTRIESVEAPVQPPVAEALSSDLSEKLGMQVMAVVVVVHTTTTTTETTVSRTATKSTKSSMATSASDSAVSTSPGWSTTHVIEQLSSTAQSLARTTSDLMMPRLSTSHIVQTTPSALEKT